MGDLSPYPHDHLTQRSPENHTSPTQIIEVPGAVRRGRPPVGLNVRTIGVGVKMYGQIGGT